MYKGRYLIVSPMMRWACIILWVSLGIIYQDGVFVEAKNPFKKVFNHILGRKPSGAKRPYEIGKPSFAGTSNTDFDFANRTGEPFEVLKPLEQQHRTSINSYYAPKMNIDQFAGPPSPIPPPPPPTQAELEALYAMEREMESYSSQRASLPKDPSHVSNPSDRKPWDRNYVGESPFERGESFRSSGKYVRVLPPAAPNGNQPFENGVKSKVRPIVAPKPKLTFNPTEQGVKSKIPPVVAPKPPVSFNLRESEGSNTTETPPPLPVKTKIHMNRTQSDRLPRHALLPPSKSLNRTQSDRIGSDEVPPPLPKKHKIHLKQKQGIN